MIQKTMQMAIHTKNMTTMAIQMAIHKRMTKYQSKMNHQIHINTVGQKNSSQINMDPETGKEAAENCHNSTRALSNSG